MSLKLRIVTSVPQEIEPRLKELGEELMKKGKGQIVSSYVKENDNTFVLIIVYQMQNRLSDAIVFRDFKKRFKKLDKKIKVERLTA